MVRALAKTLRGVGLSPTWCYYFPCTYLLLKINYIISYDKANENHLGKMVVDHLADVWNRCADVFRQMSGTDVQMTLLNISHCRWQCKRSRSWI